MGKTDRRESLRLALGAAILPFLASAPLRAANGLSGGNFVPPNGTMTFRRIIERALPGGDAVLRGTRVYDVEFTRLAGGSFKVRGFQTNAQVEAPEHLAALARLEEQRVETGLFPLTLDPNGQITDWPQRMDGPHFARALEQVRTQFVGDESEAGILIEALHNVGNQMLAFLPHDLFAPAEMPRTQSQEIELPWGEMGEVATLFEAERDPASGVMRQAYRTVTTKLSGEERQSTESWALFETE